MKKIFIVVLLFFSFFLAVLFTPKQAYGVLTNPILPSPLTGLSGSDYLSVLLSALITAVLIAGTVIFLFVFIFGAIKWIAAGGNKVAIQQAREKITHALVGVGILLSILVISNLVGYFFDIESLTTLPIQPVPPTPIPVSCFDSDGNDFYTYGYVQGTGNNCPGNYSREYDACDGTNIVERICDSNNCTSITTSCPVAGSFCSGGVCTGSSPTPTSVPTPTPTPTPTPDPATTPAPFCGDGVCEGPPSEDCHNCPSDCSPCSQCQDSCNLGPVGKVYCDSPLECVSAYGLTCRNPDCPDESDCICPTPP